MEVVRRPVTVRWRYAWEDDLAHFLKKTKVRLSIDDLKVAAVHFGVDLSELVEILRASYKALDSAADSKLFLMGDAVLRWEIERLRSISSCWPRPRRDWKGIGSEESWRTLEGSRIGLEIRGIRASLPPDRAIEIARVRADRATNQAEVYRRSGERALAVQLSERAELWTEVMAQCSSS